jgi:hypothetical protein
METQTQFLSFREWLEYIREECLKVVPIEHSEVKSGWRVNWTLYGIILDCKKRL